MKSLVIENSASKMVEAPEAEILYKYNKDETRILEKCVRFLTPLKHNKIRFHINNFNPNELEIANYRSVSKVAFDKNVTSLI
jgi:hypothetical protein